MHKLKLEDYIHLVDRMLEREGFAEAERDEIFNHPNNIDLISTYFNHKKHPSILIKKLDYDPVQMMYASSIDESLNELGNKRYKLVKENDENRIHKLTQGQQYAVDFLKPLGLNFISSSIQIKHGNLIFDDKDDTKWSIYRNGGYIRKLRSNSQWGVLYQTERGRMIDDDEYMELAHLLSQKIRKSRRPKMILECHM